MERHQRIVAASLAVVLLLAACSDGDPEASAGGIEAIEEPQPDPAESDPEPEDDEAASAVDPEPEVEPGPEPGATEIDITVVPDEITEEYVEAVLVELERLYIESYIAFREAQEPTIDVTDSLGSAFTNRQYTARLGQFIDLREAGFAGFRSAAEAGPRRHAVESVIDQSDVCIFAETRMDLSGVLVDPPAPEVTFVELGPPDGERFEELNQTPWVIHALPTGDHGELREGRPCRG
jgi:hypothetical protein